MRLELDYAILENLAEWELFYFGSYCGHELSGEFIQAVYNGEYRVTKEQVKEKLDFKNYKNCFHLYRIDKHRSGGALPNYFISILIEGWDRRYEYLLAANCLTINKTIQELYDLGKWAGLWN